MHPHAVPGCCGEMPSEAVWHFARLLPRLADAALRVELHRRAAEAGVDNSGASWEDENMFLAHWLHNEIFIPCSPQSEKY